MPISTLRSLLKQRRMGVVVICTTLFVGMYIAGEHIKGPLPSDLLHSSVSAICSIIAGGNINVVSISMHCGPSTVEIERIIEATVRRNELEEAISNHANPTSRNAVVIQRLGAALHLSMVDLKVIFAATAQNRPNVDAVVRVLSESTRVYIDTALQTAKQREIVTSSTAVSEQAQLGHLSPPSPATDPVFSDRSTANATNIPPDLTSDNSPSNQAPHPATAADIAFVYAKVSDKLSFGRMFFQCRPLPSHDWPGYESLPDGSLSSCISRGTSCVGLKWEPNYYSACMSHRKVFGMKSASVTILDPGKQRWATWIASACATAKVLRKKECVSALIEEDRRLPISGIFFEADAPDYVFYGYHYRNGLRATESTCNWANGSAGEASPTADQAKSCDGPESDLTSVSNRSFYFGVTRTDLASWSSTYAWLAPQRETSLVTGEAAVRWNQFVRDTLAKSFSNPENPMLTAYAVKRFRH